MKKTVFLVIAVTVASAIISTSAFCACGMCGDTGGTKDTAKAASTAPVKVNNTICPVLGEKVDMKNPVTVEYKGKIYNLCCPMCIDEFNKNPEKYIKKIKQ